MYDNNTRNLTIAALIVVRHRHGQGAMKGFYFTETDKIDDAIFNAWLQRVPGFRRRKALAYRKREDAALSLASYLLLEHVLGKTNLVFHFNPHGKPYLSPETEPFFSLSHTRGIAACAVSETEIGVDVERIFPYDPEIAAMICCPAELRFLDGVTDKSFHLTRFWVLKESHLKAIGQGLSIDPRTIDILDEPDESFQLQTELPGVLLAVCQRPEVMETTWTHLRLIPGTCDFL